MQIDPRDVANLSETIQDTLRFSEAGARHRALRVLSEVADKYPDFTYESSCSEGWDVVVCFSNGVEARFDHEYQALRYRFPGDVMIVTPGEATGSIIRVSNPNYEIHRTKRLMTSTRLQKKLAEEQLSEF